MNVSSDAMLPSTSKSWERPKAKGVLFGISPARTVVFFEMLLFLKNFALFAPILLKTMAYFNER